MADGEVSVRDAVRGDAAAIVAVGRTAFPMTYAGIFHDAIIRAVVGQSYSTEAVEHTIERSRQEEDAHFLVAERSGRVVGYLDYDARGGRAELHRIYVDSHLTGRGIGSRLLSELHRRLAPGTSYVLMVAAANVGAIRFYERQGFEVVAQVEGLEYYREHMGVTFPPEAPQVPSLVLRRTV